jgi:anti-sigma regulatory factor (Ser/Thr protein kinase)
LPTSRLSVAGDPALALIVRIFVGSVAERWDVPVPVRDDLRLAASELFSGAVEAGNAEIVTFELSNGDEGFELVAEDVNLHEEDPSDLAGWTGRFRLIKALFPDAVVAETAVRIRIPSPT